MRLTDFWDRMRTELGPTYAESYARDMVLSELGSRTVEQALTAGEDPKVVWRAVCVALELPATKR
ncbi:MAG: DUF3046 domain-containing protein [Sporichthyaceae bacterium]